MDYYEYPSEKEFHLKIDPSSQEWAKQPVNTTINTKNNVGYPLQTNSSARTNYVPTEQPADEPEPVTIQLYKQISVCGISNSVRLDSWTSVHTGAIPKKEPVHNPTSPHFGGERPSTDDEFGYQTSNMLNFAEERSLTPFESVECFPKPVRQERRARQKQLISQPIYESLPNPCSKVRQVAGDPFSQRSSTSLELREQPGYTDYNTEIPAQWNKLRWQDTTVVPCQPSSQADPVALAYPNSTTTTNAIYTNTPSIGERTDFVLQPPNILYAIEPDAPIQTGYTQSLDNNTDQRSLQRPKSAPLQVIPKACDASELGTPNSLISSWPENNRSTSTYQIQFISLYPENSLRSITSDLVYLVPLLTSPPTMMVAIEMQSQPPESRNPHHLGTDPSWSSERRSGILDKSLLNMGYSLVAFRIPVMLYVPLYPYILVVQNVWHSSRVEHCGIKQAIHPNGKSKLAESNSISVSTGPLKLTKIDNLTHTQPVPLEWVSKQSALEYSLEMVSNSSQMPLESERSLQHTNFDFHPMGASSSYSEVPKIGLPVAITAILQEYSNSSEIVHISNPHSDIQYLLGIPDHIIHWTLEPLLFISGEATLAKQEDEYASIACHHESPHQQQSTGDILPQIMYVTEFALIELFYLSNFEWPNAGDVPGYQVVYQSIDLPYSASYLFVTISVAVVEPFTLVSYDPHFFRPIEDPNYHGQIELYYGVLNDYTAPPSFQLLLPMIQLYNLDLKHCSDGMESHTHSDVDASGAPNCDPSVSNKNSETTMSSSSKSVSNNGQQLVALNVVLQGAYPTETALPLASIGCLHIVPTRTPDEYGSRAAYVNNVLQKNEDPDSQFYSAHLNGTQAEKNLVRIQNPPRTRFHSQSACYSRFMRHADQDATPSYSPNTQGRTRTQQFRASTERVNRLMTWDWDKTASPNDHGGSSDRQDYGWMNLRDAYEVHRETSLITEGFEPRYPLGESPSITINLSGQPGVQYEMEIGDPKGTKVGIKSYSLPSKSGTFEQSTEQDPDGQRPRKICMPLPRFLKKKVVTQEGERS